MRKERCGVGQGAQSFQAISGHATFLAPPRVYQARSSPNPILEGFLWRLNHMGLMDD